MKASLLIATLAAAFALSACDRKSEVEVTTPAADTTAPVLVTPPAIVVPAEPASEAASGATPDKAVKGLVLSE